MADDEVLCKRCGETKRRDGFYTQSYSSAPRQPCKQCLTAEKRARYAATDGSRISHGQVLREKHGLTLEQYARMLAEQDGRCAICDRPETRRGSGGRPRRLAVDHDHRTGAVRRLLCGRCHAVTAAVEDNPGLLDAVRRYLDRYAGRPS
ncbi:endonuclease domain-containing protein [Actinoplanes sp. RD1]|uniref:endonuclease domain-containing protein n=1 Tax=Actinoplanes sp. RD1 TaxID=3064538 RepID=UPI0027404337|nr:endonuclease domain-containing protein [Actinoplanes sp. RD1]